MLHNVKIDFIPPSILSQMAFERTKNWTKASATMWLETRGLEKSIALGFAVLYSAYNIVDYISATPLLVSAIALATDVLAQHGVIPSGLGMTTFLTQHGVSPEAVNAIQDITAKTAIAGGSAQIIRRASIKIPYAGEFLAGMKEMASDDGRGYRRRY